MASSESGNDHPKSSKKKPCRADARAKSSLSGKAALEGSTPAAGALFAPVRFHWILEKHGKTHAVF